jgi:peptidoglycan/xylan/chitin deacetylase (PgdA/CDA1 family)
MIDRRTVLMTLLVGGGMIPRAAHGSDFDGGIVSLTYDDGLDSQLDIAVPALEARGFRGTFYITLENITAREAEWRQIAARGHELANHTVSHPCDLGARQGRRYANIEIAPLNRILTEWDGTFSRRDFAYPCDVTNLGPGTPNQQLHRFEAVLRAQHMASARTSEGPPNSPHWARTHPYRLQALAVGYDATTLEQLLAYIRRAQVENRWAILTFHDIVPGQPSLGQTMTDFHEGLLDALAKMRIRCSRVCDVMKELSLG